MIIKYLLIIDNLRYQQFFFLMDMCTILGTVVLLAVVAFGIKYFRYKSSLHSLAKKISDLGYKVYIYPFKLSKPPIQESWQSTQKLYHDGQYDYKNQLSKYDATVSNLFFQTVIQIFNPEIVKQFFGKYNSGGYYVKNQFGIGHLQLLIGTQNLLFQEGSEWKYRRDILNTAFSINFVIDKIPKIQKITRNFLNELEKGQKTSSIKCKIDDPLYKIYSSVILSLFDKDEQIYNIGERKTNYYIKEMIDELNAAAGSGVGKLGALLGKNIMKKLISMKYKPLMKKIQLFRKTLRELIIKRIKQSRNNNQNSCKQGYIPEDLIEALAIKNQFNLDGIPINNKEKKSQGNQVITIENITNELVTLFVAGSGTTVMMTKMMICQLADHPEVLQKVREQFQRQVKTDQMTIQQLRNLKYFEKVQREVLRMDSAVGTLFTRVAQKDHFLGKIQIRKGMGVSCRLRGTHYNEIDYPSPREFKPERWDNPNLRNQYAFIPFSRNERSCIGKELLSIETKIVMVELFRKFKDIQTFKNVSDILMKMEMFYGTEDIYTISRKK